MNFNRLNRTKKLFLLCLFLLLSSCKSFLFNDDVISLADEPRDQGSDKNYQYLEKQNTEKYRDEEESEPLSDEKKRLPDVIDMADQQTIVNQGVLPRPAPVKQAVLNLPENFKSEEIIQLDYEQVEIRQILQEFADVLGLSIVIDPSITGKVTMRTSPNQPLKKKDMWSVLNMLLNELGISIEKKSGLYYVRKNPLQIPDMIGYPSLIEGTDSALALQFTPLKNISAATALEIIKPMLGNQVKIVQLASLNILAITASAEQLSRLNHLIQLIDVDSFKHRGIRLYKVKEADSKTIAEELKEVLTLIEGKQSSYEVLGLERINAVLVVSPPRRGFKQVERWINILDEGTDHNLQEQVFIYHCKSVQCETLSSTLNSIFGQDDKTQKNSSKQNEQTSKANVFRTVPKDALNIDNKNKNKAEPAKQPAKTDENKTANVKQSADINVTIVSDSDTNSLIVRTTGKDYKSLLETIRLLDKTPLQVLVSMVLAQVALDKSQSLGVDWEFNNIKDMRTDYLGGASAAITSSAGILMQGAKNHLGAQLKASIQNGDVNILSRPSLLISNNQEGIIKVGQEVPVQTSSTTNLDNSTITNNQVTESISYRSTGIELTVVPHINEEGVISMEITQSLSAIEGSNSQDASFKPTFTNQDLTTTAIVADGETIILGGLIDSTTSFNDSGIPLLKDIPFAGSLFKTQEESIQRRELVLIITPRIIGPNTNISEFNHDFMSRFSSLGHFLELELVERYIQMEKADDAETNKEMENL